MLAGLFQRALNARLHADDETAIVLEFVLRSEYLGLGRVHQRDVRLEPLKQVVAHGALLSAGGQQVNDGIELALVVEQQVSARQFNGIARHVWRNKWIAVSVA